MRRYRYDLHTHSCLSPCGDNDMTPNNLVNMAALLGCEILAVTDHNTCRNAPAVLEAGNATACWCCRGWNRTAAGIGRWMNFPNPGQDAPL